MNEAAKQLADQGIALCYHNHYIEFARLHGRLILDPICEEAPALSFGNLPSGAIGLLNSLKIAFTDAFQRRVLTCPGGKVDGVCEPYAVDVTGAGSDELGAVQDVGREIFEHAGMLDFPRRIELLGSLRVEQTQVNLPRESFLISSPDMDSESSHSGLVVLVTVTVLLLSTTILPWSRNISNRSVPARS